ncbi:hypothetical protein MMC17_006226 [Xylographa soralifera]|nr:hypothetical protein [Xylographa soralifera]
MREAIVKKGPKVEIVESPVPKPGPEQVVTKVVVAGSNPKDWKRAEVTEPSVNQGDDHAGIVHAVGENVTEFQPGDRVAGFHQMLAPGGSYAEYAVSWEHCTFHVPKNISFEEAATIPLAAMTAAVGLYQRLSLPLPWHPATKPIPLIIYGAASAVGSFAIQLAQLSNIHPLICVAGRGTKHVEGLIDKSKGDVILDYRSGDDSVVQGFKQAVEQHGKIEHAFDAVSERGSYVNICQALDKSGAITLVLPGKQYPEIPDTVTQSVTSVGSVFEAFDHDSWQKKVGTKTGNQEFGYVMFRLFSRGLGHGWFKGHPYEVVPGGLGGVEGALINLKEGKASAIKYVFRIADTEGVTS